MTDASDDTTRGLDETTRQGAVSAAVPSRIGRYHVRRVIGAGGMGTVYEAVQEHPRRTVALKVLRPGIAARSALRRFEFESQILARLRHPGIAQVYEAGTHESGTGAVPYFAMEYVPGALPINEFAVSRRLGTRERLALFAKVCDAVHHGHQKGIIHRDLKPGNILVDSGGQPKIIDFGVARATDSDMAVTTLQTDVGQLIGTVQYMSPEQCAADPNDLDTRSDVYALGVVLYELLCERPPYDVSEAAIHEAARMVREDPPARPSTVDRALGGDVETIVLKTLEKDRERRYRSSAELADDIGRYLKQEPIVARPPSLAYHVRMFARRNRAMVAAAPAAVLFLVLGIVGTTWGFVQASHARAAALVERNDAMEARQVAEWRAYVANLAVADGALERGAISVARRRLAVTSAELRGWEWRHLWRATDESRAVLGEHRYRVTTVAFHPDGRRLVSGSFDAIRIWDLATGDEIAALPKGWDKKKWGPGSSALRLDPDGSFIASTGGKETRIWDVASRRIVFAIPHVGDPNQGDVIALHPDGRRLAVGGTGATIEVWDLQERERVATWDFFEELARVRSAKSRLGSDRQTKRAEVPVLAMTFTPDGDRLIVAGILGLIVADATTGKPLVACEHGRVFPSLAVNPAGRILAMTENPRFANAGGDVRFHDTETGEELHALGGDEAPVTAAAFSPTGDRLAAGSIDGVITIWDTARRERMRTLRAHDEHTTVTSLAYSPDGSLIASGGDDGVVKIFGADTLPTITTRRPEDGVVARLALTGEGQHVVAVLDSGAIEIRDAITGRRLGTVDLGEREPSTIEHLTASADGSRVAVVWQDRTVTIADGATGTGLATIRAHVEAAGPIALSADGRLVAAVPAAPATGIGLWETATGQSRGTVASADGATRAIAFDPSGRCLAVCGDDRLSVWDTSTCAEIGSIDERATCAAFSRDGARIAVAVHHGARGDEAGSLTIVIRDRSLQKQLAVLETDGGAVESMAFSPDGRRLVTGGRDRSIRVWGTDMGEELLILTRHRAPRTAVAFTADGESVVAILEDGAVRTWTSAAPPGG